MQRGSIIQSQTAATPNAESIAGIDGKKTIYKTFQPGDRIPPHHAPVDVVVLVLDGQMDLSLGDETGRFRAGEYVYFPARQLHSLACVEEAKVLIYK